MGLISENSALKVRVGAPPEVDLSQVSSKELLDEVVTRLSS